MTNTTIDPRYIAEAREMLAAEFEKRDQPIPALRCREGAFDHVADIAIIARILSERPLYTREQELEAMEAAMQLEAMEAAMQIEATPGGMLDAYKRHLTAPPVDPLVEAIKACDYATLDAIEAEFANDLRQALAARGLKIVEAEG